VRITNLGEFQQTGVTIKRFWRQLHVRDFTYILERVDPDNLHRLNQCQPRIFMAMNHGCRAQLFTPVSDAGLETLCVA
jgi:hypothetical protein